MDATLLPEGYMFGSEGLSFNGETISNFMVRPVMLYHRQGEPFPFACDLDIYMGDTAVSRPHVLLKELSDDWWKEPPPGCWYNLGKRQPSKHLKAVFQRCFKYAPRSEVLQPEQIGWSALPSGRMAYVTGSSVIGAPSDSAAIWPPVHSSALVLETEVDCPLEAAIQYFRDLFNLVPGVTDVLLAYTLSSFLSPIFRKAGLLSRFPVILEGASESKKTTLACLTCGVFTRESNPHSCVIGLISTRHALELRAGLMRHCTLIVDDLFPDGGRTQQEKALELIRTLANQDAREKSAGNALVSNTIDCGVVMTAEFFPACERSTRTRCLRLKLQRPISNNELYPLQQNKARLGNVYEEFIKQVADRYTELIQKTTNDFNSYRSSRAQDNAPSVESERLAEIGFLLYEALEIFMMIFPQPDGDLLMESFQKRLNRQIRWQLSSQAAPNLYDITAEIPMLRRRHPEYFQDHHGCWCIEPDALCAILHSRFGAYTPDRAHIIKLLRDRGALLMDESGVATKKIKGRRYLHILPHSFQ